MSGTIAVGFFDGVHLGHQAILSGADAALTFKNHPLSVLASERAPRLIMTLADRIDAIRACGVERVTVLEFTQELANVAPEDFAARYLAGRHVRCGANWRFGKGGKGDADFLRGLGYDVVVVPSVPFVDEQSSPCSKTEISSTRIRAALESGQVDAANAMLGRPFAVCGRAFAGKGAGRSLGYPTVNLRLENLQLELPLGVYAVEAAGAAGLANYGRAPTFGECAWTEPVMEIHFLDAVPEIGGAAEPLLVKLKRFIRPERKFASLAALQAQIREDVNEFAFR